MGEPHRYSKTLLASFSLEFLALAVWTGGLVVILAAIIPTIFNSFGMEQGGRFLTRVFDGYNRVVLVAMAVMGGTLAARVWIAQAVPSRMEALLFGAMILTATVIIFILGPQSVTLQEEAFAAKDEAARKVAYDAFFRVHHIVRALYVLNLGLGIWLMVVKLKHLMKKES